MKKRIESEIKQSCYWVPLNKNSLQYDRNEGTLKEKKFNKKVLKSIRKMGLHNLFLNVENKYQCGFEIEFYINPKIIPQLQNLFSKALPKSQMLLSNTKNVVKTNGRNFYLMDETTGNPPHGLSSFEIVSPTLDFKCIPYYLVKITDILNNLGAKSDHNIGFHIHFSTVEDPLVSPVSLMFFLHKNRALPFPERKFSRDIVKQIFSYSPKNWKYIFEEISRKCYNVNFMDFNRNSHIEVRSFGGENYLKNQNGMINVFKSVLISYEDCLSKTENEIAKEIVKKYKLNRKKAELKQITYKKMLKLNKSSLWITY